MAIALFVCTVQSEANCPDSTGVNCVSAVRVQRVRSQNGLQFSLKFKDVSVGLCSTCRDAQMCTRSLSDLCKLGGSSYDGFEMQSTCAFALRKQL